MRLWHPESPGVIVEVDVLWPRYRLVMPNNLDGRPRDFATRGEVLRAYSEKKLYEHSPKLCPLGCTERH